MAEQELSNEQWAIVLHLFARLVDGADLAEVVGRQSQDAIRGALQNLWRQHLRAAKLRFLEEQITVVNELSGAGPLVFQPGEILANRFAVLRLLGRGGMGEVYLADDQRLTETVALKTIKRAFAREKQNRDIFLSEVQNSRRVTHPNVCRIFDLFEHDGVPFYSMEYISGPTLDEVLAAGPLNPERAKLLAIQSAEGLAAAHRNSILHCDFKPANILLTGSGKNERAVITDFGLARALGRTDVISHELLVGGTPPYIAPELLQGQPATVRSDIYAFGKVLEAMLPESKLAPECQAADPNRRPASLEQVLLHLRGNTSRRKWIAGLLFATAGSTVYRYAHSRPPILLGSRQRVLVNGFKPETEETARVIRNLLLLSLRQSPLLSVVGDRTYLDSDGVTLTKAGLPLLLTDLLANARQTKVNLAIDGTLRNVGPGLRLILSVYSPTASSPIYTTDVQVSRRSELVHLAELAATDLRLSAFGESSIHSTYVPLEQITSTSPEAVDCCFRAVFAYEQSDANSAIVLLDRALDLDPEFVLAHHYRALAFTTQRLMERAQAEEEKAFDHRSRVSERERNWIDSQYCNITGAWVESAAALQKNVVLFPDEAVFERQLAFALTRLGRYDEAIPHNRRAIELDPFSENNRSELLMNLAEANRVEECLAEAQKLAASDRTPSLIHRDRALAYMQQGDYERSLSECQLLGNGISERKSWSRLISLCPLIMKGRLTEAVQWIEGDLASDSAIPPADREETRTYMRHNALGQLRRIVNEPALAAEQAELLVHLQPLAANLIPLREGCALAFDLNEMELAEQGLDRLQQIAKRWPSTHSQAAVWLTQAILKDVAGENGAAALFAQAKGAWPDPLNLFYIAAWEGKTNLFETQLASLTELERLRGKIYKHHFPGLVILGWLEQAKCLQSLSRLDESLRIYQRVVTHWGQSPEARSFMRQPLKQLEYLKRRIV